MAAKHDIMKHTSKGVPKHSIMLHTSLLRGARRLRIALVGLPGAGKTTLFDAASSTAPQTGELTDTHRIYRTCTVQIGLIALEEMGLMHRIAFVMDRGFHKIGLHVGVAVPVLLGLGCNVPAISAVASTTSGRERLIASVLITFVPCSA